MAKPDGVRTPAIGHDPVTALYLTELRHDLDAIAASLDELVSAVWCLARIQVEQQATAGRLGGQGQAALRLINDALDRRAKAPVPTPRRYQEQRA